MLDNRIALLRKIRDEVRDYLFTESNKVFKSVTNYLLGKWAQPEDMLVDILADLKSAEQVAKVQPKVQPTLVPEPLSFARVAASRPDPLAKSQKRQNIVVLKPKDGSKIDTSESVKEIIFKKVIPTLKRVRVRNVRKVRDKGVLIEADSEADLQAIRKTVAKQAETIKVDEPRKIGPNS